MDHEGTSLRSALHLAARRARLRGVGLSSSAAESAAGPGSAKKDVSIPPPPIVDAEKSRLNSLVSEALRAQPAVGMRIDAVEPESAAAAAASGRSLGTELPSLPSRKNARPRGERAKFEVKVELVAAAQAAEVKRADLVEALPASAALHTGLLGRDFPAEAASAEPVEGARRAGSGERAEFEARSELGETEPGETEPGETAPGETAASSAHEIDIEIDVDIDLEDLENPEDPEDPEDPGTSQRRLLYFLRDRFINAPERVEAALQAYRGKYSNIAEYVRDVISFEPVADWLRPYIDIDTLARDWRREGIIWAIDDPGGNGEGPGVYIFLG